MRKYNKLSAYIATGASIVLATGALAISDTPSKTNTTKFLANCPGGQDVSHILRDDQEVSVLQSLTQGSPDHHQAELTCDEDGTPPRIFGMSEEWQDDDPQVLVGQINQTYPGRVIVEVSTKQETEQLVTGPYDTEFHLDLNNTEPVVLTTRQPIEDIKTYKP